MDEEGAPGEAGEAEGGGATAAAGASQCGSLAASPHISQHLPRLSRRRVAVRQPGRIHEARGCSWLLP